MLTVLLHQQDVADAPRWMKVFSVSLTAPPVDAAHDTGTFSHCQETSMYCINFFFIYFRMWRVC